MNGERSSRAIRAVALFEAFKGAIAFLVASGSLALVHKDVHEFALRLVEHVHLNPAARYPGIFLEAAGHLQDSRILLLAVGAAAYSLLRWVEAYGLYRAKTWAELLAAGSGAFYVPFELEELHRHPAWIGLALLLANLAVVAIMIRALLRKRQSARTRPDAPSARAVDNDFR